MLYISRRIAQVGADFADIIYGVVDTDDGTETVVSEDCLVECVNFCCLDIDGVPEGRGFVTPYQHSDYSQALQAKLSVLKNVNITVWNGLITGISWGVFIDNVKVRLSDFGTSVSDFVTYNNPTPASPVTFVFDDKLTSISDWSFRIDTRIYDESKRFGIDGVYADFVNDSMRFDLVGLSNNKVAESVYRQMLSYTTSFDIIYDSAKRKEAMLRKYGGRRHVIY